MNPTGQKRKLHHLAGPAGPKMTARIRKPAQGSAVRMNPRRQPTSARPTRQGHRIKRIERRSPQRKGMPPVHLKGTVGQQTQNSALARAQRRPLQSTRARTQDTLRRLPSPRQRRPLRTDLQRPSTQRLINGLVHVGLHATPCHELPVGAFYRPKCRSRSQRKRNVPKRQGIRPRKAPVGKHHHLPGPQAPIGQQPRRGAKTKGPAQSPAKRICLHKKLHKITGGGTPTDPRIGRNQNLSYRCITEPRGPLARGRAPHPRPSLPTQRTPF